MTEKKIVKRDYFNSLRNMVENTNFSTDVITNDEFLKFIDHELELLNRKRTGKGKEDAEKTANRQHYRELALAIISKSAKPINIPEIQAQDDELRKLTNQGISHVLKTLVDDGSIYRTSIKRKSHFTTDIAQVKKLQPKED